MDPVVVDARRKLIQVGADRVPYFIAEHIVLTGKQSIQENGRFTLALAGGSTPKEMIKVLTTQFSNALNWNKVYLFWSDERAVPQDHADSNYKMAMDAGMKNMPIPQSQIFRMKGEAENLDDAAKEYENILREYIPLDLVMLGMGSDGHVASLFPNTDALKIGDKLVVKNFVKEKNTNRLTFTLFCINQSKSIVIATLGESKKAMIKASLSPLKKDGPVAQQVGVPDCPALWITDQEGVLQ